MTWRSAIVKCSTCKMFDLKVRKVFDLEVGVCGGRPQARGHPAALGAQTPLTPTLIPFQRIRQAMVAFKGRDRLKLMPPAATLPRVPAFDVARLTVPA